MTRWYPVEPADAGFFSTAPHIFRYEKRFEAAPQRVWESLTSDESLAAWGPSVSRVTWTVPRPFGVGATREVVLAMGITRVRERFFRWDSSGELGYSFAVYEANVPYFRRFAEDYVVTPAGPDASTFAWTVAVEAKGAYALPVRLLAPVLKVAFGRAAADGQRYFARQG
ncbi:SRPBCC family protein [Mycolicibacterium sp. S2-37]|uniref:SRPBCC family protein n=1 Tax=Mycolicibacterium sp. S2-37 TaxID=2810297 RepID=UPI001A950FBC|nr:SRPBCC family protein [Mycolicibacterium sp. S2-37]MBO0681002.1 SRPBCC family protein [Mycolicibacterium sp. S2-37]